jgi:hypothetical protein
MPLVLAIGSGGPGGTGTMGAYDTNLDAGGGNGLAMQYKFTPALTFAASALFGRAQTTFDKVAYAAGIKYSAADLLAVAANVKYDQAAADKKQMNLAAGVSLAPLVSSLGFTALAFDATTDGTGFGAADSYIGVGESIGFKTGDLSLSLSAKELLWMGEGSKDFLPWRVQLGISNPIGNITPAVQVRYVSGNAPALTNYQEAGELGDVAFGGKDKAGLGISPQLTFALGGPSLVVGYNLQMDMSDPKPAKSMTHLIYGAFSVSF